MRTFRLCSAVLLEGCKSYPQAQRRNLGKEKTPPSKFPTSAGSTLHNNFDYFSLSSFLVELIQNLMVLGCLSPAVIHSIPGLGDWIENNVPESKPLDDEPQLPIPFLIQQIWGLLVLLPMILLQIDDVRKSHEEQTMVELVDGGAIALLLMQLKFVEDESPSVFKEVGKFVQELIASGSFVLAPLFPLLSISIHHLCCWLAIFSSSWIDFCPLRSKKASNENAMIIKSISQLLKTISAKLKQGMASLEVVLIQGGEEMQNREKLVLTHPHLHFITKIKEVKCLESELRRSIFKDFSGTLLRFSSILQFWCSVLQ
jgi:hypothetical protein